MNNNLGSDKEFWQGDYVKFNKIDPPRKTFFYQQKDEEGDVLANSEIFACYEQEAGMFGKFHKLIGVGDGMHYYETVKNAKVHEICPACGGAKTQEQAKQDSDGQTIMVKIPCTQCDGLGSWEKTLRAGMTIHVSEARRILQEAFDAELNFSRGNKSKPQYQHVSFDSTIGSHRNAKNIIDGLNLPQDQ